MFMSYLLDKDNTGTPWNPLKDPWGSADPTPLRSGSVRPWCQAVSSQYVPPPHHTGLQGPGDPPLWTPAQQRDHWSAVCGSSPAVGQAALSAGESPERTAGPVTGSGCLTSDYFLLGQKTDSPKRKAHLTSDLNPDLTPTPLTHWKAGTPWNPLKDPWGSADPTPLRSGSVRPWCQAVSSQYVPPPHHTGLQGPGDPPLWTPAQQRDHWSAVCGSSPAVGQAALSAGESPERTAGPVTGSGCLTSDYFLLGQKTDSPKRKAHLTSDLNPDLTPTPLTHWKAGLRTRTKDQYRSVYTDHQRVELEKEFQFNPYITMTRKTDLSVALLLTERQVKIWFQNRRAKERKVTRRRSQQETTPPGPAPQVTMTTSQTPASSSSTPRLVQSAVIKDEY